MSKETIALSAETLRELLSYDHDTGQFTRLKAVARKTKVGSIAGWKDAQGYIQVTVNGNRHKAHRLAWLYVYGHWPTGQIDHINGNRSDNRLLNLRDASHGENVQNRRRANSNSKTGILGVSLHRPTGRWKAQIRIDQKSIHLGLFDTKEAARDAYLTAKRRIHGGCTL